MPSQEKTCDSASGYSLPELEVRSTAYKDEEYYRKLGLLAGNKPFLQEVSERHTLYLAGIAKIDIKDPNLREKYSAIQGQLSALRWIMFELINMKPQKPSKRV
jgi:hypothetical protein